MKILAGDIGGTKTTLAIFEVNGAKLVSIVEKKYLSKDHASLTEIIQMFNKTDGPLPQLASFAIAGPVRNEVAQTTNLPWNIDAKKLETEMGFSKVCLLNDLEANAWGIGALEEKDFFVLNEGKRDPKGNASIISAGTGLGEAGLSFDGEQLVPFASEGGHSDFSPKNDLEIDLLRYLIKNSSNDAHVSWEQVLSGQGLVNVYDFLCHQKGIETPDWLIEKMETTDHAAAISMSARDARCPVCLEALDMFIGLYGAEAGNHALKIMSTAGVYIGGGIAPKNIDHFRHSNFMDNFSAKGRMKELVLDMPVKIILNERTALYGSAVFADRELKNKKSEKTIHWNVYDDTSAVVREAVKRILSAAEEAIRARGVFRLVLAGGRTPEAAYRLLVDADTDWSRWEIYFGDERCLEVNDPDRNSSMAEKTFLNAVAIASSNVHLMNSEKGAEIAAKEYSDIVKSAMPFDLVLLGIGEDGHTASLFPGQKHLLYELVHRVHNAPKPPSDRVTMSVRALSSAQEVLVLATGEGKQDAIKAWKEGAPIPISEIGNPAVVNVLMDKAAAAQKF